MNSQRFDLSTLRHFPSLCLGNQSINQSISLYFRQPEPIVTKPIHKTTSDVILDVMQTLCKTAILQQ